MDGVDRFSAAAHRVLVVDDSEVVRMKLRTLIQDDRELEFVGEATDGESGVHMAAELRPDIVVMDLKMPGMSGIKATWELGESTPESRVLVLTVSDDPEDVADAIMAGATGYVVKGASDTEIRETIHRVADGESVLSHQVAGALFERTRSHHADANGAREANGAVATATPPASTSAPALAAPEPAPNRSLNTAIVAAVAIASALVGIAAGALLF